MMIFKNDLNTLIKYAREKKEKALQKIKELEVQKKHTELQIQKQTDELVDCELNSDKENQSRLQTSLKELRNDLADFDSHINSYKKVLDKGVLNDKEIKEIRTAIENEADDRGKRIRPLNDEKEKAKKQIMTLQDRIKQIENTVNNIHSEGNSLQFQIKNILDCIDPRAAKLGYPEYENFIKLWIRGDNTEHFFEPKPKPRGFTYTERAPIEEMKIDTKPDYSDGTIYDRGSWER